MRSEFTKRIIALASKNPAQAVVVLASLIAGLVDSRDIGYYERALADRLR